MMALYMLSVLIPTVLQEQQIIVNEHPRLSQEFIQLVIFQLSGQKLFYVGQLFLAVDEDVGQAILRVHVVATHSEVGVHLRCLWANCAHTILYVMMFSGFYASQYFSKRKSRLST